MPRRIDKVNELIKQETARFIYDVLDQSYGLVTVIDVLTAKDLKTADVYISLFNPEKKNQVFKILETKKNDFQHVLGRKLKMRYTPKINFRLDSSESKISQVENILEQINRH